MVWEESELGQRRVTNHRVSVDCDERIANISSVLCMARFTKLSPVITDLSVHSNCVAQFSNFGNLVGFTLLFIQKCPALRVFAIALFFLGRDLLLHVGYVGVTVSSQQGGL